MDVVEAMHGWRSIRSFRPDRLERSLIEELLWHAVQVSTPPSSGETPWAFAVLEGVERIEAYGVRARQFARDNRPPGAEGWAWTDRPDFRVFWARPPSC
jgi:nitroreductase